MAPSSTPVLLAVFLAAALVSGLPGALADNIEVRIRSEGGTSTACVETDTCFEPSSVTVKVGDTVIMENTELPDIPILHTFTHGEAPPNQLPAHERAFDSGFLAAGQSYEWVPDTPGEYPYFCLAHPWMLGMITVVTSDGARSNVEPVHMRTVRVDGFADPITYEITGGRVLSVDPDPDLSSLLLRVVTDRDGTMTLNIPRSILDYTEDGDNPEFLVIVDGSDDPDGYSEVGSTSTHRSIRVEIHSGTSEIEIFGTRLGDIQSPPPPPPPPPPPVQDPTIKPHERVPISNLRVVDNFGATLGTIEAGQQVQIVADLTSLLERDQSFAYIVDIKGSDGRQEEPKWISGSVAEGQSFTPSVSWTPDRSGRYVITANAESRYGSGDHLSPPVTLEVVVSGISALERVPISNPRLEDNFGAVLGTAKVDQQIQIVVDLTNAQSIEQEFAYIVKIRDARGVEVHDAWILGMVDDDESYSPMVSWTPSKAGAYEAVISVQSDNISGDYLSPPARIPITVKDGGSPPREPPAGARMSISDPRVTDSVGNRLSEIDPGDLVQLTATFRNNGDRFQEFTYVAEIQNGQDTEKKHLKTQLGPKALASSGLSWTPKEHGTYKVTVSARPSADSTENLAPPAVLSVQVGDLVPATERMSLGRPTVGDGDIRPGQVVEVAGKITNNQDKDQRHVYIVQITDESGDVVYITWAAEDIAANGEFSPSISWRPEAPGRYEVTTYVWSSLVDAPEALAAPSTAVIHVAEPGDPPKPATGVVTVSTDKGSYDAGEPITIRGHIGSILGFGVTIQVFAPDAGFGSVVFRGQPILSADGTFEAQVPTDNTHMKWPGKYTVRAEYGGAQRSAETTFMLTGNKDPVVPDMKPDPAITEHERMEEDPPRLGTEVVPVSTDKRSYDAGETITVRGKVDSTLGFGVTVQVFAPDAGFGSVVYRSQPILNTDGTFEARFDAGGSLMVWPGEYTIRVEYGGAQRYGETTFLFTGRPDPAAPVREPDPSITGTTITIEGATDLITYEITGGRVLAATASPSTTSLLLDIKAHENGIISLNMPRTIIDAVQNGYDIEFFILIDAEERPFTEIKSTSTHRTLNIPFSAVNTDIEIIGTFVVP